MDIAQLTSTPQGKFKLDRKELMIKLSPMLLNFPNISQSLM
jgi:hypothetical protein